MKLLTLLHCFLTSFALLISNRFRIFATFPYGVLGLVLYLVISIIDLCLLFYFYLAATLEILVWKSGGKTMLLKASNSAPHSVIKTFCPQN